MENFNDTSPRKFDSIETMNPETIAVLGAQGHFGTSLCARLAEMKGESAVIIPTSDKQANKEIASRSDTIIVAVRPDQVEAVLREISDRPDRLKPTACIVSFAARYPLTSILEITKRPAARAMADHEWNLSAFALGGGFSEEEFRSEFAGLTRTDSIHLGTDREMDMFSVFLVHVFVVSVLQRQGLLPNAPEHFAFISEKMGISVQELQKFQTTGEPEQVLSTGATPGGITEATLSLIREDPSISPAQLHDAVASRFVSREA